MVLNNLSCQIHPVTSHLTFYFAQQPHDQGQYLVARMLRHEIHIEHIHFHTDLAGMAASSQTLTGPSFPWRWKDGSNQFKSQGFADRDQYISYWFLAWFLQVHTLVSWPVPGQQKMDDVTLAGCRGHCSGGFIAMSPCLLMYNTYQVPLCLYDHIFVLCFLCLPR